MGQTLWLWKCINLLLFSFTLQPTYSTGCEYIYMYAWVEWAELASDLYKQSMFVYYLTKKCDYKYVVYEDSWEIFDPRAWYVLACCRGAFVMITWDDSPFWAHRSYRCKCISMSCWLLHLFKIKTIHIVPSGLQRLRGSRKVKPRKSQRRKHIWTYLLQRISSSKREYSFLPSSIRG